MEEEEKNHDMNDLMEARPQPPKQSPLQVYLTYLPDGAQGSKYNLTMKQDGYFDGIHAKIMYDSMIIYTIQIIL